MVLGLFEKKRDTITPHPSPLQALGISLMALHWYTNIILVTKKPFLSLFPVISY
jgi:hypothetical protein